MVIRTQGSHHRLRHLDGSAQFVDEPAAKAIWSQFIAGARPIRLSVAKTSGSTSRPASASQ